MPRHTGTAIGLFLVSVVALIIGWRTFDFVCDDAFIAFRYAENLREGYGLVWNRPPFGPVEGYTSLSWVLLCAGLWELTGIEPPAFVNSVLLLCSIGSLAVVATLVWKMPLSTRMQPFRLAWLALVLAGTVTNRTFLTWTSSGLEQGLFTLLLLCFVAVATLQPIDRRRLLGLGLLAAAMSLTRPDGLLFVGITGLMWLVWMREHRRVADLWLLTPALVPVAHLAWRMGFYGYPLPNTYYVKVGAAWPEMGLLYLATFCLEYAYLLMLPLLWWWARRLLAERPSLGWERGIRWLAVSAVALHAAYYVLKVGGDHFEFRIFHHLVPLLLVAFVWLADRVELRPRRALAWMAAMLLVGLVLPWGDWLLTKDFREKTEQGLPYLHQAGQWPLPLRPWARLHEAMVNRLVAHSIGVRQISHEIFAERTQVGRTPERGGYTLPEGDIPVYITGTVGLPGWTMPDVAIIDGYGLNDVVIARMPGAFAKRYMGHDRRAPDGYLECFDANVSIEHRQVVVRKRAQPLTAERIRHCERTYLERATR